MAERRIPRTWITVRPPRVPVSFKLDRRVPLMALLLLAFTLIVLVLSISYGS